MTHDNTCGPGPSGSSPSAMSNSTVSSNNECGSTVVLNGSLDLNQVEVEVCEGEASKDFAESVEDFELPPFITGDPGNNRMSSALDTSMEDLLLPDDDDRPPPEIDLMVVVPPSNITVRKKKFPAPLTAAMISEIPSCAIPKLPKSFLDSFYISSSEDEKTKEEAKPTESRRKRIFLSKADRTILAAIRSPKPSTSAVIKRERETFKKKIAEGPSSRGDSGSREGRGMQRRSLQYGRVSSPIKKFVKKEDPGKKRKEEQLEQQTEVEEIIAEVSIKAGGGKNLSDSEVFEVQDSDEKVIESTPLSPKRTEMTRSPESQTESIESASPPQEPSDARRSSLSPKKPSSNVNFGGKSSPVKHLPLTLKKILQMKTCMIPLVRLDPSKLTQKGSKSAGRGNSSRVPDKRPVSVSPASGSNYAANTSESDSELDNLFEQVSPTEIKRKYHVLSKLSGPKSAQKNLQKYGDPVKENRNGASSCTVEVSTTFIKRKEEVATLEKDEGKSVRAAACHDTKQFTSGFSKNKKTRSMEIQDNVPAGPSSNGHLVTEFKNPDLPIDRKYVKNQEKVELSKASQTTATQTELTMDEIEALLSLRDKSDSKDLANDSSINGSRSNGHSSSSPSNGNLNPKKRKSRVSSRELSTLLNGNTITNGGLKNRTNGNCSSSDEAMTPEHTSLQRKSSRAKKLRIDNDWLYFSGK